MLLDGNLGFVHQILSWLRVDEGSTLGTMLSYNAGILDHLIVLERFGPATLTSGELSEQRATEWSAYYGYLGSAVLAGRGDAFWSFHRRGLATIDRRLRRRDLWVYTLRVAVSLVLNPLDTVTGRWTELRRDRGK